MNTNRSGLPRLLYIGHVPVQATVAGSTLIYRLLQDYPADRLRIWEENLLPAIESARLPGVQYERFFVAPPRLMHTRFEARVRKILFDRAPSTARRLARKVGRDGWQPEAVMTVVHGATWLVGYHVARRLNLPLHLLVHDEILNSCHLPIQCKEEVDAQFGEVWRYATSRLCASRFMAEKYTAEFGARGELLHYGRAVSALEFTTPPDRLKMPAQSLHFAYAGSVASVAYGMLLGALAKLLEQRGHRFSLFTSMASDAGQRYGLDGPNVTLRPIVPLNDLIRFLHEQADVLYVPMSYEPDDRPNMEISFPTKLADYTAAALPILIQGPPYCSAVRWSLEYPFSAEVVDRPPDLGGAIERLENPEHRWRLAEGAVVASQACFTQEKSIAVWHEHLRAVETAKAV
jgi:hypothetical protein